MMTEKSNYGCRCMRTWRLCFRRVLEKPNASDGWIIPLQQHHIDQYLEYKKMHACMLYYYTREYHDGCEHWIKTGEVQAGMNIEGMYVYEQYTFANQYATGCYGDCTGYRWRVYNNLVDAIQADGMKVDLCFELSTIGREHYKMFALWRKGWLTRAWIIMWMRKQDCVWSAMPRDLTRWFVENYIGEDVWKCFHYRRGATATMHYNFALYPGEMQPSGHFNRARTEFMNGYEIEPI